MVREKDKDIIIACAVQYSPVVVRSSYIRFSSGKHCKEIGGRDVFTPIVDFNPRINVLPHPWGVLVEDLSREGVSCVVRDVVVHHHDHIVHVEAFFFQNLIRVGHVGLMSVVREGVWACHQHSPAALRGYLLRQAEAKEYAKHYYTDWILRFFHLISYYNSKLEFFIIYY